MKKEHSNGLSRNLVGAIVLVLGIAAAFALFYSSNVRRITRQNENYIADIALQRADLIEDLFRENLAYIDSAAIVLETEFENQEIDAAKLNVPDESDIDATELAQVADILRIYEERFAFDYLRFIDLYGRDYTTGEKVIAANVSEREYFRKGMQGQSGMTYILDSKVTSERQIGFYSPVRQNGEIAGLVVGFYGEAFIGKLLSVSLFDYDCDVLLCDRDGNIIYNTGKDGAGLTNFLEGLDTLEVNWGSKYPSSVSSWRNNWPQISTYFKYPQELRRLIYTTNQIENFNRQLRKVTKTRTIFPSDDALFKLLYLATTDITEKWTGRDRDWGKVLSQLCIYFDDRIEPGDLE